MPSAHRTCLEAFREGYFRGVGSPSRANGILLSEETLACGIELTYRKIASASANGGLIVSIWSHVCRILFLFHCKCAASASARLFSLSLSLSFE
mmetsp:Transcript_16437/g.31173  ORF Transcript_16437/g.31173 Transcript_16437/m.31173 type:complete len:94 (-) Transcript_16437:15-296(-)